MNLQKIFWFIQNLIFFYQILHGDQPYLKAEYIL